MLFPVLFFSNTYKQQCQFCRTNKNPRKLFAPKLRSPIFIIRSPFVILPKLHPSTDYGPWNGIMYWHNILWVQQPVEGREQWWEGGGGGGWKWIWKRPHVCMWPWRDLHFKDSCPLARDVERLGIEHSTEHFATWKPIFTSFLLIFLHS
jgi:hypothetical protein